MPSFAGVGAKHNTKLLATIMAMECVQLVLPEVGEMQPAQIVEAREDLKPYLKPFRMSLLGFAGKLNSAIEASSDYGEIQSAAEFIAQTEVYPQLEEFKNALAKSHQRGWWPRTWEFGTQSVELGALYSSGNFPAALIGTAKALGSWFIAGLTDKTPRSGLHYLLKLQDRAAPTAKP